MKGGPLTPGLANGALLAIVLGGVWSMLWPGGSQGAFAVVGATAALAASMQMPITAVVLIFEFTRVNQDFLIPVLLAVGGSMVGFHACAKRVSLWRGRASFFGISGATRAR